MSVGSISFASTYDNPNLPLAAPFAERIAALPGLRAWWRVDAGATVTSDGAITSVPQRSKHPSAPLTAGDAPPVWTGAAVGPYPGARMTGGGAKSLFTTALPVSLTAPFSFVWFGNLRANSAAHQYFMAAWAGTGKSATLIVRQTDQRVAFTHGSGTALGPAIRAGEPALVIGSSSGTQVRVWHAGVLSGAIATDNQAGASALTLGAVDGTGLFSAACDFAEALVFQADLCNDPAAIDLLRRYARRVYRAQ